MTRVLGSLLVAFLIAGCVPTPSPSPAVPTVSSEAATLTITASGEFCGPWWFGCGGVLVIEPPGWQLPTDWSSGADDTRFAAERIAGSEEPATVMGVARQGQDRIEPGDYTVAGILTMQSDVATQPPSASLGCSRELTVPRGTLAVTISIDFGVAGCTLTVSMDAPTPDPST
jgi:hypothetical protein